MLGYEMDIINIEIDINILYPNNDLYCNNMRKLNNDIDVEKIDNSFVQNIYNMRECKILCVNSLGELGLGQRGDCPRGGNPPFVPNFLYVCGTYPEHIF